MPTALPGISITQASHLLQEQDRIIRTFPEVQTVFGTVGRSNSATDNAPLDMYDTTDFATLIWALPRIWCKGQKETLWENTLPYLAAGSIVRLAHAALCPSVRSGT